MIIPTPMPLGQQSKPFDDPDWLYEIKHDGFRALALIDRGYC
jgi:bifunctional non-homologous end joining protein LigD